MSYGGFGDYDRNTCACGCKARVAYEGLEPRFASTTCRSRWVARLAIGPDAGPAPVVLDVRSQDPPQPAPPVAIEEVAEVQAEFAQRVTVAPQVEAALSGMLVRPRPGALLKFLLRVARKVR